MSREETSVAFPSVPRLENASGAALGLLVKLHRWAGIVLCLVFAAWCVSGAILLFVPFPELSYGAWLQRSSQIDFDKLAITPQAALGRVRDASGVYLVDVAGRPVYVVSAGRNLPIAISGETGRPLDPVSPPAARHIAELYEGRQAATIEGPFDYDAWTVRNRLNPWRPFYKISFADPQRTDVYVAARTGEVVQRSQAWARAWTWAGGITHWIYFVPLAKYKWWEPGLWALGVAGIATILAGVWLGTYRAVKRSRRREGLSPFRGWTRWHHLFGLSAGLLLLSFTVSGWLSTDHGRLFSQTLLSNAESERYQGGPLVGVAGAITLADMRSLGAASHIRFVGVGGQAVVTAEGAGMPARILLVWDKGSQRVDRVPPALIARASAAAWPEDRLGAVVPAASDDIHLRTEAVQTFQGGQITGAPLIVRLVGPDPIRLYVDTGSGKIITARDTSHLVYDWVYWTIHTFNYPGLSNRPALRIGIVLISLAVMLAFVVTAMIIGVKRVRLSIR